jgi:hypothetical protein
MDPTVQLGIDMVIWFNVETTKRSCRLGFNELTKVRVFVIHGSHFVHN